MNSIKLGGKPVYDAPAGTSGFTNNFAWHSGASRAGMGKFLMMRADYDAIANTAPVSLEMLSDQGPGLVLSVVLAGAAPAFPAVDSADDVVEVVVFDLRIKKNSPIDRAFNVGQLGQATFYKSTTFGADGTTEWTWQQLCDDLEINVDNAAMPTGWKPRNVYWDNVSKARVIDDLAARLFLVAGFDGTTIKLYDPGETDTDNDTLLSDADAYFLSGGDTSRNLKARIPGTIRVTFPGINAGSSDPYATAGRLYSKDVATSGDSDSSLTQTLHVGEYQGVYSGSSFTNQAELDIVAADMAVRCVSAMSTDFSEATYAGIWPFKLDGYIRGVRWISDREGARTIIRTNNDRDFSALGELNRANETLQNMLIAGLGETRVTMTAGGTRMIIAAADSLVCVKLTANRTRGGKYDGEIGVGPAILADTDLALPESYTFTGTANAVIENADEDILPTHWLKTPSYGIGKVTGVVTAAGADQGKRIVVIQSGQARTASPADIAAGGNTTTPVELHWSREVVTSFGYKGDGPVSFTFLSRPPVESSPNGDGVIHKYGFFRTAVADASGKLVSISDETMFTLETSKPACVDGGL